MKINSVKVIVLLLFSLPSFSDWVRFYGPEFGYEVIVTESGYVVAGLGFNDGITGRDNYYLINTNYYGDTLWTRTFGGMERVSALALTETPDGEYYLVGKTGGSPYPYGDACIMRVTRDGDSLWARKFVEPGDNYFNSILALGDERYIVAGTWQTLGSLGPDAYLAEFDGDGDSIWTKCYDLGGEEHIRSVSRNSDGGYFLVGAISDIGSLYFDLLAIRTNRAGDTLWTRRYGGDLFDEGRDGFQTEDGGFIICGLFQNTRNNIWLLKLDENGDTLWTRLFSPGLGAMGMSITASEEGGFVIAGRLDEYDSTLVRYDTDFYILAVDSLGDTLWSRSLDGFGTDILYSIKRTPKSGYIATGFSSDTTRCCVCLVKVDAVGIIERQSLPGEFSFSTYPNPFNSSVRISISPPYQGGDVRRTEGVQIEIFDIAGRKITQLGSAPFGSAQGAAIWSLSEVETRSSSDGCRAESRQTETSAPRVFLWQPDETVGSGIYLVRATINDNKGLKPFVQTKRIVFLK